MTVPFSGADAPLQSLIQALRAWLSPEEFVGYLKGKITELNAKTVQSRSIEDLERASTYQEFLCQFVREVGVDEAFPPTLFWGNDGATVDDDDEVVAIADMVTVVAVHSNREPYTRWAVRYPISDDGEADVDWFDGEAAAAAFVAKLEADVAEAALLAQPEGSA